MSESAQTNPQRLRPLAYHRELVDFLKASEPKLWEFHSKHLHKQEYIDALRLDLLKSTVRLNRDAQPALYAVTDRAAKALNVDVPVSYYQSQSADIARINASVCCLPNECHVILSGPVLTTLNESELRALAGHELSHYCFLQSDDGEMGVADRILAAIVADPRHEPSHGLSAQRFRQYTEIYADRGSFLATNDLHATVSCLVKVETALQQVDAAAYISQAEEIFANGDVTTQGVTHPETFIRARALAQWVRNETLAASEIRRMLEGPIQMDRLDLLAQKRLTEISRRFISCLLEPRWFRSAPVLAHARLCFPDFVAPDYVQHPAAIVSDLQPLHASVRDYLCFLMLDFAAVDPVLEDLPLLRGFELAQALECRERLEELAAKELKLTKKALAKLREDGPGLLERAKHSNGENSAPSPDSVTGPDSVRGKGAAG